MALVQAVQAVSTLHIIDRMAAGPAILDLGFMAVVIDLLFETEDMSKLFLLAKCIIGLTTKLQNRRLLIP